MANFSSEEYTWSDLDIAVNGVILGKCQSVEYMEKIETEILRGKGRKGFQVADGNHSVEGSLELLQSEAEQMLALTGNKGIMGLRDLTITVAYKEIESGRLSVRSIVGVRITENGETIKQGDMKIVVKFPFVALDINYIV